MLHFGVQSLAFLKAPDDLEEIARLRIAVWTEHAHQALRPDMGQRRFCRPAATDQKTSQPADVLVTSGVIAIARSGT